jgi:hypothetical protein
MVLLPQLFNICVCFAGIEFFDVFISLLAYFGVIHWHCNSVISYFYMRTY